MRVYPELVWIRTSLMVAGTEDARMMARRGHWWLWLALAGCGGSRLSPSSSGAGRPGKLPSFDAAGGQTGRAADAGVSFTPDASVGDPGGQARFDAGASRFDAGSARRDGGAVVIPPDAGGADKPQFAPYPVGCAHAAPGWVPAAPADHLSPQACAAPIALSSTVKADTTAVPHFFRCGTFGPEIEIDARLSPDGSLLATLTSAGTVRLFSTLEWREIAQLAPMSGRIDAFAFSPDGRRLATLAMEPGELTLWNTNGSVDRTFTGPGTQGHAPVAQAAVAFSRDGLRVASSLGTIVALDGRAGVSMGEASPFIDQLAFTMCDAKLYVRRYYPVGDSSWTTEVSLIDTQTGQAQYLVDKADNGFGGSALSADGRLIAVTRAGHPNQASELSIYRGDTGDLVDQRMDWLPGTIQAFTPDDKALLVANDGRLAQWNIESSLVVASFPFDVGAKLLGFPRSDTMTIGTPAGVVSWSLTGRGQIGSRGFGATAASWAADGTSGVAVAADGVLFHVWHEPDATEVCAPAAPGSTAAVTGFGLSGDGQVLGFGTMDGAVELFDTATGATRAQMSTSERPIVSVSLSWDGTTVAARGSASEPVQLWSMGGGLTSLALPEDTAFFSLSPDGRTIAAADGGGASTTLIDVATGKTRTTAADGAWTAGALFSPDSLELAGRSGGLATWRAADGVRDDLLTAPGGAIPADTPLDPFSVALASDWSRAAVVNFDRLVVWDPRTGAEMSEVPGLGTGLPSTVAAVAGATAAANDYLEPYNGVASWVLRLYDAPSGIELRAFDAGPATRLVLLGNDGTRAYTLEGPDVIAWCR
jgi:WD40 repeat protein